MDFDGLFTICLDLPSGVDASLTCLPGSMAALVGRVALHFLEAVQGR